MYKIYIIEQLHQLRAVVSCALPSSNRLFFSAELGSVDVTARVLLRVTRVGAASSSPEGNLPAEEVTFFVSFAGDTLLAVLEAGVARERLGVRRRGVEDAAGFFTERAGERERARDELLTDVLLGDFVGVVFVTLAGVAFTRDLVLGGDFALSSIFTFLRGVFARVRLLRAGVELESDAIL